MCGNAPDSGPYLWSAILLWLLIGIFRTGRSGCTQLQTSLDSVNTAGATTLDEGLTNSVSWMRSFEANDLLDVPILACNWGTRPQPKRNDQTLFVTNSVRPSWDLTFFFAMNNLRRIFDNEISRKCLQLISHSYVHLSRRAFLHAESAHFMRCNWLAQWKGIRWHFAYHCPYLCGQMSLEYFLHAGKKNLDAHA